MKIWINSNPLFLNLITTYLAQTDCLHPYLNAKFYQHGHRSWPGNALVYAHFTNSLIDALVLTENGGNIYVHMSNAVEYYNFQPLITAILRYTKPYSILGHPSHLIPFRAPCFSERSIVIDYYLMTHPYQQQLPDIRLKDVSFIESTIKSFNILKDLEIDYQHEEVLIKNRHHANMNLILALYKKKLVTDRGFHLEKHGVAIAKASLNTASCSYDLLGGVFTVKNYRHQGYSNYLLSLVLADAKKRERGVTLFVKSHNHQAIALYLNLGFKKLQPLQIIYSSP